MNEAEGTVVRVEGEFAWVRAERVGQACGACASRAGCSSAHSAAAALGGDGLLDERRDPLLLRVPNPIRARPGDRVVIRAADGLILRAVWFAYGLPLVFALLGSALAAELTGSETTAAAAALGGLGAGFLALRRKGKMTHRKEPIFSIEFKHSFE